MPNPNLLPSKVAVLAGIIDPDAYAVSTVTTGWVSMVTYQQIQAIVMAGTLGAAATIDAKLEQATDASGTGAKDITGKAITQLTQAGGDSDKQAIINLRDDELDVANDFTDVRLSMTIAVLASDASAMILGHNARYKPATDLASVDEVVE